MNTMSNDPAIIDEMLRTAQDHRRCRHERQDRGAPATTSAATWPSNGYRVFPVNPALEEVLGMPMLSPTSTPRRPPHAQQTGQGIDLVDVFRASEHVPADRRRRDPARHSLSLAAGRGHSRRSCGPRPRRRRQVRPERLHLPRARGATGIARETELASKQAGK